MWFDSHKDVNPKKDIPKINFPCCPNNDIPLEGIEKVCDILVIKRPRIITQGYFLVLKCLGAQMFLESIFLAFTCCMLFFKIELAFGWLYAVWAVPALIGGLLVVYTSRYNLTRLERQH